MKTLLLPLCLLLGLTTCKKDDTDPNGLPAATQEGKNTAGFLLDGKPWLPKNSPLNAGQSPVGVSWGYRSISGKRPLQLSFNRYRSDSDDTGLNFHFSDIRRSGTFRLDQDTDPFIVTGSEPPYAVYTIYDPTPKRRFYTGSAAKGQIIISRFDTVARVVAGTFAAKVKEDGGPDSLTITQGRFDLKF